MENMISIFFSSTFKDMQEERDIIQKYVRPRAEAYAEKHSESINFIDLRWGIDTSRMNEQDAMDKIISVCKDKILDSYPYFIGLLGQEYGSETDYKLGDNSWLTDGERIGVTEYEISTRLELGNDNLAFFVREDVKNVNPRAQELREAISKPRNFRNRLSIEYVRNFIVGTHYILVWCCHLCYYSIRMTWLRFKIMERTVLEQ